MLIGSVGHSWATRNVQVLAVFAPLLALTGVLGFLLPASVALMSGATPYNLFHLVAAAAGGGVLARRSVGGAATFNLVFGCIDLWQAVAGLTGLFPARVFELQPADHVVHVVVGAFLLAVGYLGKKAS